MAAIAEELGHFGSQPSASAEAARIDVAIEAAEDARDRTFPASPISSNVSPPPSGSDDEPDVAELERLADAARAARQP